MTVENFAKDIVKRVLPWARPDPEIALDGGGVNRELAGRRAAVG